VRARAAPRGSSLLTGRPTRSPESRPRRRSGSRTRRARPRSPTRRTPRRRRVLRSRRRPPACRSGASPTPRSRSGRAETGSPPRRATAAGKKRSADRKRRPDRWRARALPPPRAGSRAESDRRGDGPPYGASTGRRSPLGRGTTELDASRVPARARGAGGQAPPPRGLRRTVGARAREIVAGLLSCCAPAPGIRFMSVLRSSRIQGDTPLPIRLNSRSTLGRYRTKT
jgi:hypothetical protein